MSKFDDFRLIRPLRSLNRIAQILLALTLVVALNILASAYFKRYDLTHTQKYSLALETKAYLQNLEEPLDIIVAMPLQSKDSKSLLKDLQRLLREYEYESRKNGEPMVRVEFVDIFQNPFRAQEIRDTYGVDEDAVLLVAQEDRHHVVDGTKLYRNNQKGNPSAFLGEQLFTTAILDVSHPDKDVIYFTIGHGEMGLKDVDGKRGLTNFAQYFRKRGFDLRTLDVSAVPEIPSDADLLLIADPAGAFLDYEVEKLRTWMRDQRGRLLLFLSVGSDSGLDSLLQDWGLYAADMGVADAAPGAVTPDGKILVRSFSPTHPITEFLAQAQLRVVGGLSRPIVPNPLTPTDERLTVEPLAASSEQSWGEVSYRSGNIQYNEGQDLRGPVPVGMIAQRQSGSRMDISLTGGKVVAYGNASFINNAHFNQPGNRLLVNNSINWLLDRDKLLNNIPPRPIESMQLSLTTPDLFGLGQRFLIVPGVLAVLGLFVFLLRRR